MLAWIHDRFGEAWGPLRVLDSIGVRAGLAFVFAFALALVLGPALLARLRAAGPGERAAASDDPEVGALYAAAGKSGTPTMGGVFWVGAVLGALLLCARLDEPLVLIGAALMVGMSLLGFFDDWIKAHREGGRNGLSRRVKFWASVAVAGAAMLAYWGLGDPARGYPEIRSVYFPVFKDVVLPFGGWGLLGLLGFLLLEVMVVLGGSHSVNLADGLDGLAAGSALPVFGALTVSLYAVGHAGFAEYLHLPHVLGAGEVAVMAGAVMGATLGFLWFNAYPADVFLGDSGSLPMGALMGWFAVVAKAELALPLIAGVFVWEAGTSFVQISACKLFGKRPFLKAPWHHVPQLRGMPEPRIVVRFWIVSALCAAGGLLLLKLR